MSRPVKCRLVEGIPAADYFKPRGMPLRLLEEVVLPREGLEALRLADVEGLDHREAAARMGVSRPTFSRVLAAARRVTAQALTRGLALRVEGGHFAVRPESGTAPPSTEEPRDRGRRKS